MAKNHIKLSKFALALCLIFAAGQAWGATYYMRADGTVLAASKANATGCGSADSALNVTQHNAASFATNDTIYLCSDGGDYGATSLVVPTPGVTYSAFGTQTPVWDCTQGTSPHFLSGSNTVVNGITFQGGTAANDVQFMAHGGSGPTTIKYCNFIDSDVAIDKDGNSNCNVYYNIFYGSNNRTTNFFLPRNNGTWNVFYNKFTGSITNPNISRIYIGAATNFYNNALSNAGDYIFNVGAVVTVNIKNNVFTDWQADPTKGQAYLGTVSAAATINFTNNWVPVRWDGLRQTIWNNAGGATITSNDNVYNNPLISAPKFGQLNITLDDSTGCGSAITLAASNYNPEGMYINCAATWADIATLNQAAIQSYINAGNDIAPHGFSHTDLTATTLMTIDGPTANSKLTISTTTTDPDSDNWTGSMLLCETDCTGENLKATINFNASQGGTVKTNIGDIVAYINGRNLGDGAWAASYDTARIGYSAKTTTLAATTLKNVSGSSALGPDQTAFNKVEISEPVSKLQAWVRSGATGRASTYTVSSFISPFDIVSSNSINAIAATGVKGTRNADYLTYNMVNSLANFAPFAWSYYNDVSFRSGGGGYAGASNVSFVAGTKTINVVGSTSTGFESGDAIKIENTTSNNGNFTIATVTPSGGDTAIVVNETFTDESNTSAKLLCKVKWQKNAVALAMHLEASGQFAEIQSHCSPDDCVSAPGLGLTYTEHYWLIESIRNFKHANLKTGINSFLSNIWSLGNAPNGNAYSVSAGSTAAPDTTLRFTLTFTDMSDFKLSVGSPAIDAGTPVSGLHTSGSSVITGGDFGGNTRLYGKGIDIGAFERPKFIDGIPGKMWDATPKYYTVP